MTGFSWTWIPGYGNLAQLLHEKLRGKEEGPLNWDETCTLAFNALEEAVITAPELGRFKPPNVGKPFRLYVSEGRNCSWDVRTNVDGGGVGCVPVLQPMAYLSKQLDQVARGWPPASRQWSHCS